jgi:hypothetical protein
MQAPVDLYPVPRLTIPPPVHGRSAAQPHELPLLSAFTGTTTPRLLVIDDDPAVLSIVAGIGRAAGFVVSECDGDDT